MIARIAIVATLLAGLLVGGAIYYLQVYAYYDEVSAEQAGGVRLVSATGEAAEPIPFENFTAIDSESSPIRFRACFTTPLDLPQLAANYVIYDDPKPLNAPGWFNCFDAKAIDMALERGEAVAFLETPNIRYGIDRVVAITETGRGYAWHQINKCGEEVFDGQPAPEGCPPAPEGLN